MERRRARCDWRDRHGHNHIQKIGEGRQELRRHADRREAASSCRWQPLDREGTRRRTRASLHSGDAGVATGRRAPPRRAYRQRRSRGAQGNQVELTALRNRWPRLVLRHPLLHELRQSGILPRCVVESRPASESKSKDTRYLDIHENDQFGEASLSARVRQASRLPGERT
jgi:hypothetical protein